MSVDVIPKMTMRVVDSDPRKKRQWNFIRPDGTCISDIWFDAVCPFLTFPRDTTTVHLDGKMNLIDVDGNLLLPEWVDSIRIWSKNTSRHPWVLVQNHSEMNLFNIRTKEYVFDESFLNILTSFEYKEELFAWFINHKGKMNIYKVSDNKFISKDWFDDTSLYLNMGLCGVKLNKKWNFIRLDNGSLISDEWFDTIDSDENGKPIGFRRVEISI